MKFFIIFLLFYYSSILLSSSNTDSETITIKKTYTFPMQKVSFLKTEDKWIGQDKSGREYNFFENDLYPIKCVNSNDTVVSGAIVFEDLEPNPSWIHASLFNNKLASMYIEHPFIETPSGIRVGMSLEKVKKIVNIEFLEKFKDNDNSNYWVYKTQNNFYLTFTNDKNIIQYYEIEKNKFLYTTPSWKKSRDLLRIENSILYEIGISLIDTCETKTNEIH